MKQPSNDICTRIDDVQVDIVWHCRGFWRVWVGRYKSHPIRTRRLAKKYARTYLNMCVIADEIVDEILAEKESQA